MNLKESLRLFITLLLKTFAHINLIQCFSTRSDFFSCRGHSATSVDVFGCHTEGLLIARVAAIMCRTATMPTKNYPT